MRISKHAFEKDKTVCLNLSAQFLSEFYKKEFIQLLPYVDLLFGNDEEATTFAKNVLNIQVDKY